MSYESEKVHAAHTEAAPAKNNGFKPAPLVTRAGGRSRTSQIRAARQSPAELLTAIANALDLEPGAVPHKARRRLE